MGLGAHDPLTSGPPTFAIWRAPDAPDDARELAEVLRGTGEARVHLADTFQAWLDLEADVFVLRGGNDPRCQRWFDASVTGEALDLVRRRRVLGIGREGGAVLGALGLPVYAHTAHFTGRYTSATQHQSAGVPVGVVGPLLRTHVPRVPHGPHRTPDHEELVAAVFLPPWSFEARVVEPLLRWEEAPLYAPAVHRNQHAWLGIGHPVAAWSVGYAAWVREVAGRLAREPIQPLLLPRPELAAPGTHRFDLAACASLDQPSSKHFYLAAESAVRVRAALSGPGSGGLVLFFGSGGYGLECAREDREASESLAFEQLLLPRMLAANPARLWEIHATNFGDLPLRDVRLTIDVDPKPTLKLPGGEVVPLNGPVTDEDQLARLVDAYLASGPELRPDIAALLAEAAGVATCYLRRVVRNLADPKLWMAHQELFEDVKNRRHQPRAPFPREPT